MNHFKLSPLEGKRGLGILNMHEHYLALNVKYYLICSEDIRYKNSGDWL